MSERGFFIGLPSAGAVKAAIDVARMSPCKKSQRGAVAFISRDHRTEVLATGTNHQPAPFACTGSEACREHCGLLCMHAEQNALRSLDTNLLHRTIDRCDVTLLHIKLVNGDPIAGGPPSCLQCSRLIVDSEVEGIWLYQDWHPDVIAARRARKRSLQANPTGEVIVKHAMVDALEKQHEKEPVWVFWYREEFHRETMRNCEAMP